jgi:hypothetical protein
MFWLFIVGLFRYICIFYYLYVDSLTYAFRWSAFLCRIKFCDTLVEFFLSKHHHHHHRAISFSLLRLVANHSRLIVNDVFFNGAELKIKQAESPKELLILDQNDEGNNTGLQYHLFL